MLISASSPFSHFFLLMVSMVNRFSFLVFFFFFLRGGGGGLQIFINCFCYFVSETVKLLQVGILCFISFTEQATVVPDLKTVVWRYLKMVDSRSNRHYKLV